MDTFVLLKTLYMLAVPPASLAVALLLGWAFALFGWRPLARWIVALSIVELLVMSFPPIADAMMRCLENQSRAAELARPRCCFADIVVLGGGLASAMAPQCLFSRVFN